MHSETADNWSQSKLIANPAARRPAWPCNLETQACLCHLQLSLTPPASQGGVHLIIEEDAELFSLQLSARSSVLGFLLLPRPPFFPP